ncbi:hypothetical protein Pst134EA_022376 [Puccinia striiformis f. sp. tritici]|nr:hypothetical protein Pst134EA_022376 [Puccinia striiformis f. sp. tritici]KAH9454882.1 hypothetical protein Pst134EA_022376 [Puccinia striiformis f. sp. tritici]
MADSQKVIWSMKFKKNTPNGKPAGTPIPIPTTKTRPPTATIDLTGIDQASPASSSRFQLQGNRPKPNSFPSGYNPYRASQKAPAHDRKTQYEPTTTSSIKTAQPTQHNQQKVKPIQVAKSQSNPLRKNLPLKTILAGARPSPLASTSSRHLAVNKTCSTDSGSTRPSSSSTSSRAPTTDMTSSRSAPTFKTQQTGGTLSLSSRSPPAFKPSSSRAKLPTSNNARGRQSPPRCSSNSRISRRSTSTESASIVSNTPTTMTTRGPPSIDLLADMQNALSVRGMSLQGHQITQTTGCDDLQDLDQITTTKTTCLPSIDLLADMQNTLLVRGMSLQGQRVHQITDYDVEDFEQMMPEELSIEMTQMINNPESLCPFCDELLPKKPSTRFIELLNYLKNKPGVKLRKGSKNPFALYLPFSDIASCCQLHRAEKKLIPMGLQKGWPSKIDFQKLPKRIKAHYGYLSRICTREIVSDFMDMARKEWKEQGPRKVNSIAHELATFQIEQPGYYGVRGYEVIYRTLQARFLSSSRIDSITKLAQPLSPDFLIRKVLVPETALCLIADDLKLKVTDDRVRTTLEESRTFGSIMFPDQDDNKEIESSESDSRQSLSSSSSLDQEEVDKPSVPPPPPKRPRPNKKRPRKSDSCEIEIVPSKNPLQRSRQLSTSLDSQQPIGKVKSPSSKSDHNHPSKHCEADCIRPTFSSKPLKDGWKATLC